MEHEHDPMIRHGEMNADVLAEHLDRVNIRLQRGEYGGQVVRQRPWSAIRESLIDFLLDQSSAESEGGEISVDNRADINRLVAVKDFQNNSFVLDLLARRRNYLLPQINSGSEVELAQVLDDMQSVARIRSARKGSYNNIASYNPNAEGGNLLEEDPYEHQLERVFEIEEYELKTILNSFDDLPDAEHNKKTLRELIETKSPDVMAQLTQITVSLLRWLSKFKLKELKFGTTALTEEVTQVLARMESPLYLDSVTSLTDEQVRLLVTRVYPTFLRRLVNISESAAITMFLSDSYILFSLDELKLGRALKDDLRTKQEYYIARSNLYKLAQDRVGQVASQEKLSEREQELLLSTLYSMILNAGSIEELSTDYSHLQHSEKPLQVTTWQTLNQLKDEPVVNLVYNKLAKVRKAQEKYRDK